MAERSDRTIVKAVAVSWGGLWEVRGYGIKFEYDDGVRGGVHIGDQIEAEQAAKDAVGKSCAFIDELRGRSNDGPRSLAGRRPIE
jgi:hypothetical protein